jgi:hypothetical protein
MNVRVKSQVAVRAIQPWLKFEVPFSEAGLNDRIQCAGLHTGASAVPAVVAFRKAAADSIKHTPTYTRVGYLRAVELGVEGSMSYIELRTQLLLAKKIPMKQIPFWAFALIGVFLARSREIDLPEDCRIFGFMSNLMQDSTLVPFIEREHGKTWLHVVPWTLEGAQVRSTDIVTFRHG